MLRAPLILSNTHHRKLHALLHDLLGARARRTSNEHEHDSTCSVLVLVERAPSTSIYPVDLYITTWKTCLMQFFTL